ncbi:leucine-rich repeat receptor-like serine/threonine-protein kinase At1g17230 [Punica granatum]|uniref:Leucine-rich repeat receptor-like serine/threonine-protein kinase At1g17230 n=1 Tax=Punica granatum TaxID=22663 RepID=A0A6P8C6P6_PUNGR|nr:leucine-rich repeat receptor-like serine/threonine-protein kinase At1g17230 [Punica granatum]XP_031378500.1 leucine-rich repeat receptor-like serine/threonine-protein kinase At1g17230 [Punica granatum]
MSDIHYDVMIEPVLEYGDCSLTGQVHLSLIELLHLRYLNLSWKNFLYTEISAFLGSLSDLVYLNLSNESFYGKVLLHLGKLSSLQYLDLNIIIGYNYNSSAISVDNLEWLSDIPSLKRLDLSDLTVRNGQDKWTKRKNCREKLKFWGKEHF